MTVQASVILFDDKVLMKRINKLLAGLTDKTKVMNRIGVVAEKNIEEHFDEEVDSHGVGWDPLSEVTIKLRRNKDQNQIKILQDTGKLRTINFEADKNSVLVGTIVNYGEIHQAGGWSEFNGKQVPIPKREWLYLNKKGKERIETTVTEYLKEITK